MWVLKMKMWNWEKLIQFSRPLAHGRTVNNLAFNFNFISFVPVPILNFVPVLHCSQNMPVGSASSLTQSVGFAELGELLLIKLVMHASTAGSFWPEAVLNSAELIHSLCGLADSASQFWPMVSFLRNSKWFQMSIDYLLELSALFCHFILVILSQFLQCLFFWFFHLG